MLHAQELLHQLNGCRFGHPLYVYQQIGSTSDRAKLLAENGAPEGLLIVAEEQTAGRGRGGRAWLTPPDSALAFSLVLRPALTAEQAARLVMLAGVAVCEAVEQVAEVQPRLKWPNDVLLNGRKFAGLLAESALRGEALEYVVLGIGLNVSWAPAPEQVDFPATCLQAEAGREVDRAGLLRAILLRLEARYGQLSDEAAFPTLFADWRARLVMLGEPAELRLETETLAGVAEDVAADGALLFRLPSGEVRRVLAGNLHLRPASAV
ncbi:MAG: biotin--[acetyl-CoA-carboxylase] ligase [Anaerolineales bacterium]|nr:biotin--[acetyl-CoA-carboxylase] ligase [Anaerolineales bacterium]